MPDVRRKQQPIDYTPITEIAGTQLNQEQLKRFAHRYAFGGELAEERRTLEVACGAGAGAGYLRQQARWYVGLDYTESLLHEVRTHYGARVPLLCGDAQRLPFADGAFDLLLCFEAIYYLTDYGKFLADARHILSTNGSILIVWSNPDWPDFVPGPMSTHYPAGPELLEQMKQVGFQDIRLYGTLPTTDYQAQQSLINRMRRILLRRTFLRARWLPVPHALLDHLKRLFYGQLTFLPAELDRCMIEELADQLPLVPLDGDRPDTVHRVLYLCARVGA